MRVFAENPSPLPRVEWARVATPDGFKRAQIAIGPAEKIEAEVTLDETAMVPPTEGAFPLMLEANGQNCNFEFIEALPEPPCTTLHFRGRIPNTMLVADLWATSSPGSGVVPFELLIVNSDPSTTEMYTTVNVTLTGLNGVKVVVWWGPWRGVAVVNDSVELLRGQTLADTQGQAWMGFLALHGSEEGAAWQYGPVMAMSPADEWVDRWGPFGKVPSFAGYSENDYVQEIHRWFLKMVTTAGQPWLAPDLGLLPGAGSTGSQQDFGTSKLGPAFMRAGAGPLHALHALQASLMDSCRPGDFREVSGAPTKPWEHPNHVTWSGYTHYHSGVSTDRLGKAAEPTPRWTGGWGGKDREHWSSLNLCGAYLLTGSNILLHRIECEARLFLSGETIHPGLSTSGVGAPRGVGRTFLTASWIDCCLPDGELRTHFRQRVLDRLVRIEELTRHGTPVDPLGTIEDPRTIPDVEVVAPWQEAQGIIGLRAAQLRFPAAAETCRVILERVCRTFAEYGWWRDANGWHLADYHAFNEGQPLPPEAYPGPLVVRREGFEEWSWGAVIISHVLAPSARTAELVAAVPSPTKVADAEWLAVR